jgi:gas vesicle protein
MDKEIREYHNNNNTLLGVLTGLLFGGLAGAGAMFLLAPQSGQRTRMQIREKGVELRDQTTGLVEAASARVWLAEKKISRDGKRKLNELIYHSQVWTMEQLKRVSEALATWKKANLNY